MTREQEREDYEWKVTFYEDLVADPGARALAWRVAEDAHTGDNPLSPADQHAARRYLRACILRMSVREISQLNTHACASLWARGIVGAWRYRQTAPRVDGKRKRPRRAARTE